MVCLNAIALPTGYRCFQRLPPKFCASLVRAQDKMFTGQHLSVGPNVRSIGLMLKKDLWFHSIICVFSGHL